MKFKIFQAYYDQSQVDQLDPDFTPFDNTDNPHPELREHYIHKKVYDIAVNEGLDFWGTMSWKFKEKFSGINGKLLTEIVKLNPGFDILFFNPFPEQQVHCYNVWELGEWCHPGILEIGEELLPLIGLNKNLLYHPMGENSFCFSCSFMGNKKFWDHWLGMIDGYLEKLPELSPPVLAKHNSSAGYFDTSLWYFPFIHERLFSTFVIAYNNQYRVGTYKMSWKDLNPTYETLNRLKSQGILSRDREYMEAWLKLRNRNMNQVISMKRFANGEYVDYADQWIKAYFNNMENNVE